MLSMTSSPSFPISGIHLIHAIYISYQKQLHVLDAMITPGLYGYRMYCLAAAIMQLCKHVVSKNSLDPLSVN